MSGGWMVGEFKQYGMVLEVGAQQTDDDMWFRIYKDGENRFDSPFIDLAPELQVEFARLLLEGRDRGPDALEYGFPIYESTWDPERGQRKVVTSRGSNKFSECEHDAEVEPSVDEMRPLSEDEIDWIEWFRKNPNSNAPTRALWGASDYIGLIVRLKDQLDAVIAGEARAAAKVEPARRREFAKLQFELGD